jgi:hypothetical protein
VIVLAGLVGGPLLGVAAGVSTQVIRPEAVWRRRGAEGGIAAAIGLAAGAVGVAVESVSGSPVAAAALATGAVVVVNAVGRFRRHPRTQAGPAS